MRLKYEKVIHHAIVNNFLGGNIRKRAVTLKVVVNTIYSLQPLSRFLIIKKGPGSLLLSRLHTIVAVIDA